MDNTWMAGSSGAMMRCGLNSTVIGAQKNSKENEREGRPVA